MQTACSFLPELASGRGTSRRSRMVEGQPCLCFNYDPLQHRVCIFEHVDGRDPERSDPLRSKPLVAIQITFGPVASRMPFTIDFDRQPRIAAEEVDDIGTGRVLPTKLQAFRTLAEPLPEDHLRERHLAAEIAGAV